MSNQRTSNFKKETATDSKQDAEISTLTNTLNNLVVPVPTDIICNTIRVNSHTSTVGHVSINAEGSQLSILGSNTIQGQTLGVYINGSICSTDYVQGDTLYSINDAYFGSNDNNTTNVLHVKKKYQSNCI